MKIRRCAVLYIEPRESLDIDWSALFKGGSALAASVSLQALAPHLGHEVEIDADAARVLAALGQTVWLELADCEQRFGQAAIARLLEQGLLIGDGDDAACTAMRERDDTLRGQHWRPLSALSHAFSRWDKVRVETGMQVQSFQQLVDKYGPPPPPAIHRAPLEQAVKLPAPRTGALDDTLFRRYTGRNYDTTVALPLDVAARLLQRTFGAQESRHVGEDGFVFKKFSPSGGALHPIDAYVLAQRIDGVASGIYHYHPVDHTLEPVRLMAPDALAALALQLVADQHWFADAPMQVVLTARVARSFWKYRNHAKAYKAIMLDGGHLSQTFYLLAAEAGMSAFITAAVNEVEIERALGLDHLVDAVVAVCGCGPASGQRTTVELRLGE